MPYVNIKITDDGVTDEKQSELIARVTQALVDVFDKKPEQTHIVIDEVPETNWGFAGVRTDIYRARNRPD